MDLVRIVVFAVLCMCVGIVAEAGQVTMASYDFDGDYIDELVRTDEQKSITIIHVYKRLADSYFVKPIARFEVPGRLVQVPEIADVNADGKNEYFFATGSDMGIIYYDVAKGEFVRSSAFTAKDPETPVADPGVLAFEDESSDADKKADAEREYQAVVGGQAMTTL